GRWFANADPKALVKGLKILAVVLFVAIIVSLAVTGRLAWAVMALPALLPWFMRARALHRAARNFQRMSAGLRGGGAGGTPGQTSEVETQYLKMTLDHGSGSMHGEVVNGAHAGRNLDDMSLPDLLDLLNTCIVNDQQSAQVLEAYLDRAHADWRERVQTEQAHTGGQGRAGGPAATGAMSRDEALEVLGLEPGASEDEIKAAHHRLIANLHPDRGGSTYLAAKINQAKDVLLRA
ncbi:MAG: DnaJ domain-containing protein, partial [Rhodospirillales bacterium]|nr:DnaJ domain-containing protein [Rhodospirillales bacterium]